MRRNRLLDPLIIQGVVTVCFTAAVSRPSPTEIGRMAPVRIGRSLKDRLGPRRRAGEKGVRPQVLPPKQGTQARSSTESTVSKHRQVRLVCLSLTHPTNDRFKSKTAPILGCPSSSGLDEQRKDQ